MTSQVVEKRPSTALPSPLVVATYYYVHLTPRGFGRLVSERFLATCEQGLFSILIESNRFLLTGAAALHHGDAWLTFLQIKPKGLSNKLSPLPLWEGIKGRGFWECRTLLRVLIFIDEA